MTPHRRPWTSIAGVHADWLRLVEPNGPFLTLPVLRRVLAQRPSTTSTPTPWLRCAGTWPTSTPTTPLSITTWVEWVLTDLLAYGHRLQSGPAGAGDPGRRRR